MLIQSNKETVEYGEDQQGMVMAGYQSIRILHCPQSGPNDLTLSHKFPPG